MAAAASAGPDWRGLESALQDLTQRVQMLHSQWPNGPSVPAAEDEDFRSCLGEPHLDLDPDLGTDLDFPELRVRKKPSIFASRAPADLAMLDSIYQPNLYAWQASSEDVGVEDDVSGWQLAVQSRLRARQRALEEADLDAARHLHRQEMEDADIFLDSFARSASGLACSSVASSSAPSFGGPPPTASRALAAGLGRNGCHGGSAGPLPPAPPSSSRQRLFERPAAEAGPCPTPSMGAWPDLKPSAIGRWRPASGMAAAAAAAPAHPRSQSEYLDELLQSSPQGYAAAVRSLASASVAHDAQRYSFAGPTPSAAAAARRRPTVV